MSANGKIDLHVDDNFMGNIERTKFSSNGSVTFNSTGTISFIRYFDVDLYAT